MLLGPKQRDLSGQNFEICLIKKYLILTILGVNFCRFLEIEDFQNRIKTLKKPISNFCPKKSLCIGPNNIS